MNHQANRSAAGRKPVPLNLGNKSMNKPVLYFYRLTGVRMVSNLPVVDFLKSYKAAVRIAIALRTGTRIEGDDRLQSRLIFSKKSYLIFRSRLISRRKQRSTTFLGNFMNFKKLFPVLPKDLVDEAIAKHKNVISQVDHLDITPIVQSSLQGVVSSFLKGVKYNYWDPAAHVTSRVNDKAAYFNTANSTYRRIRGIHSLPLRSQPIWFSPYKSQIRADASKTILNNCSLLASCSDEYDLGEEQRVKAVAVPDKGKVRIITKEFGESKGLNHLQQLLSKNLERIPGMLNRRPVTVRDIEYINSDPDCGTDAWFVSGDYESATDFLSLELTSEVIWSIQEHLQMPISVLSAALVSGTPRLVEYPDGSSVLQVRGQLMGNLLSFPILCIINLAAFRSIFPKRRVLINGDDILFKANQSEYEQFKQTVKSFSLELNLQKTIFSPFIANMNSTTFYVNGCEVQACPRLPYACLKEFETESLKGLDSRTILVTKKFMTFKSNLPLLGIREHGGLGVNLPDCDLNRTHRFHLKQANNSMGRSYYAKMIRDRDTLKGDLRPLLSYSKFMEFEPTEKNPSFYRRIKSITHGKSRSIRLQLKAW